MKTFYTITNDRSKLYSLTVSKQKKLEKLFPSFTNKHSVKCSDDEHNNALNWIEENGKLLGEVNCLAY